ncbi:MAG: CDP-diacylglycerol--glycerol-3-phosphate 3-phosphatidyltransferase [Alicyclobacillaceae bacterium]|nr:CDP-diacylglycerol--glycerol-3-phosphate 3-phosphatidyltransferase [Alicyclobacillaceae bacterium]
MNLPNALTIVRFLLIPVYVIVFFSRLPWNMEGALLVLLLAGLTDVLDGYWARRHKQVTELGIMLDPLADKLMMVAVLVSFVIAGRVEWWMAGLLAFREITMIVCSGLFHRRGKKIVPAMIWGKVTTVLYYVTVVAVLFEWPVMNTLLWLTVVFSFLTSLIYLAKFREMNRPFA